MVTIDSESLRPPTRLRPFYQQVAQLSLLFLGGLAMLAAATALMMELAYGAL
ncbi:hypothetical protein RBU55_19715 [Pseudomonas chlororaphis subsp. aurantiaca]|uniref:hypothetical protein n=1 Tax=Pseudomonas chlororaphis TaxID=587753 RepID=UPI0027DE14F2|nr:hypothetical protein [Pseudomonas chlororaphis]WMI97784.1 hypothetical protein RBU55_19715 [Pseudomonas chlororaphis subsp. aurantiaca]